MYGFHTCPKSHHSDCNASIGRSHFSFSCFHLNEEYEQVLSQVYINSTSTRVERKIYWSPVEYTVMIFCLRSNKRVNHFLHVALFSFQTQSKVCTGWFKNESCIEKRFFCKFVMFSCNQLQDKITACKIHDSFMHPR